MPEESFVDSSEIKKLAKYFESHSQDLEKHLKDFISKTGEESITDGFGVLTESEEVTTAYIQYATDVAEAMRSVYRHLDAIGGALRQVTENSQSTDENLSALFGPGGEGKE